MSKSPKLNIVLRPSVPADPTSGRPGVPGVYVLFEDHEVNIENPETANLLRAHAGFGQDYTEITEGEMELIKRQQNMNVPAQQATEFKYGHIERITGRPNVKITPEMQKAIVELAAAAAKEMFDKMVQNSKQSTDNQDTQPEKTAVETDSPEDTEIKKVVTRGRGIKK